MKIAPIVAALESLPQQPRREVVQMTPQGEPMARSLFWQWWQECCVEFSSCTSWLLPPGCQNWRPMIAMTQSGFLVTRLCGKQGWWPKKSCSVPMDPLSKIECCPGPSVNPSRKTNKTKRESQPTDFHTNRRKNL